MLEQLETQFEGQIYIDIEMNSLEDAYINIAKAEEKLHAEESGKTLDESPFEGE